jgi:hypothetical protein
MPSTAEKIYETAKQLPDALALEALHYLEYLRQRADDRGQARDLMRAQRQSMQHTWDNAEDEAWNDAQTR